METEGLSYENDILNAAVHAVNTEIDRAILEAMFFDAASVVDKVARLAEHDAAPAGSSVELELEEERARTRLLQGRGQADEGELEEAREGHRPALG